MLSQMLLHPKVVHFPIALLLTGLLIELYSLWRKNDEGMVRFSSLLFIGGLIGAFLAVATGALAENALGHDSPNHDKVHEHQYIMLAATGVWLLSLLVLRYRRSFLIVCYLVISAMVIFGANKGGDLVYKYGIGVEPVQKGTGHQHEKPGHHHEKSSPP